MRPLRPRLVRLASSFEVLNKTFLDERRIHVRLLLMDAAEEEEELPPPEVEEVASMLAAAASAACQRYAQHFHANRPGYISPLARHDACASLSV